jgi:hypothetical protein
MEGYRAGSLRMSQLQNPPESPFAKGGLGGLEAIGAALVGNRSWIPACAGMTERVQGRVPAGVWGVPRFLLFPPKIGGQGVEMPLGQTPGGPTALQSVRSASAHRGSVAAA